MLTCPRCQLPLARHGSGGQALWICDYCHGHALGLAVFRQKFKAEAAHTIWEAAQQGLPSQLRCPSCSGQMAAALLASVGEHMQLDVCTRCQFVWLDAAEVAAMPAKVTRVEAQKPELPQAAREALAMMEVRRLAEKAEAEGPPDNDLKRLAGWIGLPVEQQIDELRRKPWATWILGAAIVLMALPGILNPTYIRSFGFVPDAPFRMGGLTLITAFFLHGGVMHLLSNLYFLLTFGGNVEDAAGKLRFLALIVASTLLGDVCHWLFDPNSTVPSIGASGGISGVIAFYALAFPHKRLGIGFVHYFRFHWINFSARWGFVLWIGVQLWGVYAQAKGFSNVASTAHLGGALGGVVFWWIWRGRWQPGSGERVLQS